MSQPGSLTGVTVIDLTRYLPGPYCTRILADLGASVVRVELPAGDPARDMPWFDLVNAGKRVVALDLRDRGGRDTLENLLANARVCVEGFRPSTARALGVDAASIRARHPHLVHCSISGYGQTGPDSERAGHDLNYQAEAGLLGKTPAAPSLLAADITGAFHAAIRILAALVRGQGESIDVSLAGAAASWRPFTPPAILRGEYACYNVYETAGGGPLVLGALEPKFWARFCERVERPDWIPFQFAPEPARARLVAEVRALFRMRDCEHWIRIFSGVDCCLSRATMNV